MFKGEHCANCSYKHFPRPADITIGDFWKIDNFTKDMNDKKGTSAFLLNNEKSKRIFEIIKSKFKKIKQMPLESAGWQIDVKHKIPRTPACKNFFENINKKPYNQNIIDAPKETNVGITNWWFINNRGAVLTNYALNEMVKDFGYNPLTINYITPFERENYNTKGYVRKFTEKYIKRTRWIENKAELKSLNRDIKTFICGSDQIFNYFPCKAHNSLYYFDWVDAINNKLISCSASFAGKDFHATETQKMFVKHSLNRFDYHSVREAAGVDIMKNEFQIECEQILDPVFCIDKQKYIDIASNSTDKIEEPFIVYYYTIPERCENTALIEYIKRKTRVERAINLFDWNIPMENWLWYIINAKFILTNSFHGSCFSLIFNKPFCAFILNKKTDTRFDTLKDLSHLNERFFNDVNDIFNSDYLFESVDFTYYNSSIGNKISKARTFMKNAIDAPKICKLTPEQKMYDALINDYEEKIDKAMNGYVSRINKMESDITQQNLQIKKLKERMLISRICCFAKNIFSVRNEYSGNKKHKVLTVLGIKAKFRLKTRQPYTDRE